MAKVPTIRDVAELADVSKATVSRYLNGSLALPPDTAKRVDDAVVALNYRQNSLARRLSLGSSETIGLAMPEVANPFFAELADAVEEAASESGYGLALCITRNKLERETLYLRWLDTRHLDGLIFATNRPDDGSLRSLIGERANIVLVDEDVPGTDVPKVFVDNIEGSYLATRHLLDAGHRRIAHVTGPETLFTVQERLEGYRRALAEAQVPFDADLVRYGSYDRRFGRAVGADLIKCAHPPTALFATSDYCGRRARCTARARAGRARLHVDRRLRRHGIRQPPDASNHHSAPVGRRAWPDRRRPAGRDADRTSHLLAHRATPAGRVDRTCVGRSAALRLAAAFLPPSLRPSPPYLPVSFLKRLTAQYSRINFYKPVYKRAAQCRLRP